MQLYLENNKELKLASLAEAEEAESTKLPIPVRCVECIGGTGNIQQVRFQGSDEFEGFIDFNEMAFNADGRPVKSISAYECLGKQIWVCVGRDASTLELEYSRRRAQEMAYEHITKELDKGEVLDCTVRSIGEIGVFVDCGYGLVGLIPSQRIGISGRDNKHYDFYPGQKVKAVYYGKNRHGVLLSTREVFGTFKQITASMVVGNIYEGIVIGKTDSKVVVELTPNLSSIVKTPIADTFEVGTTVKVKLNSINNDRQQVGCSILSGEKAREFKKLVTGDYYKPVVDKLEVPFDEWKMR